MKNNCFAFNASNITGEESDSGYFNRKLNTAIKGYLGEVKRRIIDIIRDYIADSRRRFNFYNHQYSYPIIGDIDLSTLIEVVKIAPVEGYTTTILQCHPEDKQFPFWMTSTTIKRLPVKLTELFHRNNRWVSVYLVEDKNGKHQLYFAKGDYVLNGSQPTIYLDTTYDIDGTHALDEIFSSIETYGKMVSEKLTDVKSDDNE